MNRNNFRHSHTWADATYEDRRIAKLATPPLHNADHPLRAEIGRNSYGGFHAWLQGWGYPTFEELPSFESEPRAAEDALDALVSKGYGLLDPGHLIDLYDLFDEPVSQYEDSADSAEAPAAAMVGSLTGDNGRELATDDEIPFYQQEEHDGTP